MLVEGTKAGIGWEAGIRTVRVAGFADGCREVTAALSYWFGVTA